MLNVCRLNCFGNGKSVGKSVCAQYAPLLPEGLRLKVMIELYHR